MTARLEHANLIVRDIDRMIAFLQTAFPEFQVRSDQRDLLGRRWVHVGSDDTYVALNQASEESDAPFVPYAGRPGTNHLGYEVDDAEAVRQRLSAAGYRESTFPNRHPNRKRVYFYDAEGHDWEFVEYATEDPRARNDYRQPDF
jgi:catechol 2,3-dioxygenase-like lactoylglutathione lyase family enzyme